MWWHANKAMKKSPIAFLGIVLTTSAFAYATRDMGLRLQAETWFDGCMLAMAESSLFDAMKTGRGLELVNNYCKCEEQAVNVRRFPSQGVEVQFSTQRLTEIGIEATIYCMYELKELREIYLPNND